MLTDLDCINLIMAQYNSDPIFDFGESNENNVCYNVKNYGNCDVVVLEGSHDIPDWIHDFDAAIICPPGLAGAGVHAGFYQGLANVFATVMPKLSKTKPIYVIGHSLGAGRAHILAAMLIVAGYNIISVVFGAPRAGDAKLAEIVNKAPARSYWNYHSEDRHDLIGDVPVYLDLIAEFVVIVVRILIDVAPEPGDSWGIFAYHHSELYDKGLKNASH